MTTGSFKQQVIFLGTSNLERSHGFYTEALGLDLVLDQGSCRIYGSSPHSFIGVCTGLPADASASCILTLVTDDVEGAFAHAVRHGAVVESKPAYHPRYNITHCFLHDPDGHRIEIQCFHDPQWPGSKPRGSS